MKRTLFFIIYLSFTSSIFAQSIKWERKIENKKQDYLSDVITTIDQQYLVSGSSNTNERNFDFHIIKLNQQGNTVWNKFFGGDKNDFLNTSISLTDGSFILAGSSYSNRSFDKNFDNMGLSDTWLIKIDENGNEIWQKSLGTNYKEEVKKVTLTSKSDLILALDTKIDLPEVGKNNVQLIQLDSKGDFVKDIFISTRVSDNIESLVSTQDGGVILGIYSRSETHAKGGNNLEVSLDSVQNNYRKFNTTTIIHKNDKFYGEGDYWILKFDSDLNLEWQKTFGGDKDDHLRNIAETEDGYLIVGESNSNISGNKKTDNENFTDSWNIKVDKNGNEIWQKSYDFGKIDIPMSLDVIQNYKMSTSKGYLIGGFSQQDHKLERNDERFWLLYLNNEGDEIWRKYIDKKGNSMNRLVSAKFIENAYILAGTTSEEIGFEDWNIVKLTDKEISELEEKDHFRIYPVPSSTYLYVDLNIDFYTADISIFDLAGTLIHQQTTKNKITKLNTSSLIGGVYILKVETNTNQSFNQKFIKK
ncbi:T9SS type A sorting domain-containing protein [Empedobacter brevis]